MTTSRLIRHLVSPEGTRRALACIAALAAVVATAIGGCSGDAEEASPRAATVVSTTRPAETFAPLVNLYEREPARPIAAGDFVAHSSLTMANAPCRSQETVAIGGPRLRLGRDDPAPVLRLGRLGGPRPYRQHPRSADCRGHQPRAYATSQHTRPYDPGRPESLRPHEGFYLDLLTARLYGTARYRRVSSGDLHVAGVPAYYERRRESVDGAPGVRIDYWMLYGIEGYPGGDATAIALTHEGDWERISVLLRRGGRPGRWRPVSVRYHAHDRHRDVPWNAVELAAAAPDRPPSHPVVYAARGNHASYPAAGTTAVRHELPGGPPVLLPDRRRACADCPIWRTWRQLRSVRRQPWYGYGGAWGAVGSSAASSPIGPSPHTP